MSFFNTFDTFSSRGWLILNLSACTIEAVQSFINLVLILSMFFVSVGLPQVEVHSDHSDDSQHQSDVTFHNVNHDQESKGPIDVNHCEHIHIHAHGTSAFIPCEVSLNISLNEILSHVSFSNQTQLKPQFSYMSHYRPPIS